MLTFNLMGFHLSVNWNNMVSQLLALQPKNRWDSQQKHQIQLKPSKGEMIADAIFKKKDPQLPFASHG